MLLLCCAPVVFAAATSPIQSRLERADAVVQKEKLAQQIPGIAMAVIDHGRVVRARGYGYANVEHSVRLPRKPCFSRDRSASSSPPLP